MVLIHFLPSSGVRQIRPSSVPHQISPVAKVRGGDRVDHAAPRPGDRTVFHRRRVEILRHARIVARQVGADRFPVLSPVLGAKEALVREIQDLRVAPRKHERKRPCVPVTVGMGARRIHAAVLQRLGVETRHSRAVDGPGIERIGGDVPVFVSDVDRSPVERQDPLPVALGEDSRGAGILLGAVDAIRIARVGRDMVKLRRRLVVPGAPRLAPVDRHRRALVDGRDHPPRIRRVDPETMVIVAARRPLERSERRAPVDRPVDRRVADVNDVGVLRIDGHAAEIPSALPDPRVPGTPGPRPAPVVGTVEPALFRVDDRVDAAGRRRRERKADPAEPLGRQTVPPDRGPVDSAVGGPIEPRSAAVGRRIRVPRGPAGLPQGGEHDVRAARFDRDVDRARVVALKKNAAPRASAVGGPIDAAGRVGSVRVSENRHECDPRVPGIDRDSSDLMRVGEARSRPAASRVRRHVHAVSVRNVRPHVGLAGADVNHAGIRRRDGDRADRGDRLGVENRRPGPAGVARLPHPAPDGAEVEVIGIARNAGGRESPSAAKRADAPPAQVREEPVLERPRRGRPRYRGEGEDQREHPAARKTQATSDRG